MSFASAIGFLADYRTTRATALNNERRMQWSTYPVDTLQTLTDTFGSAVENSEWEAETAEDEPDLAKLVGLRLKIAFLAGCRRDLRTQYVARADSPRTAIDFDRFEYMRLWFNNLRQKILDRVIARTAGE